MFYVSGRGWVAAGDLNEGDEVYLIDGSAAYVTGAELEQFEEPVTVYNLEVDDLHTYFVGDTAILVHNQYEVGAVGNTTDGKPKPARPKDFEVNSGSDMIPTNSKFGKSTFTSMDNAKKAGLTGVWYELPDDFTLPEGFEIYPDGADVGGSMAYGHRSIIVTIEMTLDEFNKEFLSWPWKPGGKIKK